MQRKSRILTRAAVGIGALGLLGGLAGPALADPAPVAVSAAVVVPSTLTFTFSTSPLSFSVAPGATQYGAVAFQVQSNDPDGYGVMQTASGPLTNGGLSIPDSTLSEVLNYGTGTNLSGGTVPPQLLSTTPYAVISGSTGVSKSPDDNYSEDWTAANLPGNTPAGSYTTTITYTASGNA